MADGRRYPALSFAHLAALDVGPPDLFDLLADAGFSSVCLRMRRTLPGTPEYPLLSAGERREARARMQATGVSVLSIELVGLDRSLEVSALQPMLETGAELGATRIVAAGDDDDFGVVAEKLAAVCELAKPYGMAVDLEFMPFRGVRTLGDATKVLAASRQSNAHILVDALHFYRSGSSLDELRRIDPKLIGGYQICDAPAAAPVDLAHEARTARLRPGYGELDLNALLDALPANVAIGVEVPLALEFPHLNSWQHAKLAGDATRDFLARHAEMRQR